MQAQYTRVYNTRDHLVQALSCHLTNINNNNNNKASKVKQSLRLPLSGHAYPVKQHWGTSVGTQKVPPGLLPIIGDIDSWHCSGHVQYTHT